MRFYSKVRVDGCGMLWTGPVNNHGYGRFEIYRGAKRIRILSHRLAYKLATGEDPGGVFCAMSVTLPRAVRRIASCPELRPRTFTTPWIAGVLTVRACFCGIATGMRRPSSGLTLASSAVIAATQSSRSPSSHVIAGR